MVRDAWRVAAGTVVMCAVASASGCGRVRGVVAPDRPEPVLQYSRAWRPGDLSFAAHAPCLAVADGEGNVDVWDTSTWSRLGSLRIGPHREPASYSGVIALSPDGRRLASEDDSGEVVLWDFATKSVRTRLPGNVGYPVSIAWSRDGARIAAGGQSAVVIWDAASSKVIRTFTSGGSVAFSPDGRHVAIGWDSVAVYDIASGRKIRSFADKAGVQGPVAFSSDGNLLATGGEDPDWEPGPLPTDEDGNTYSPSEAFYAHQMKVKVWDVRTGKLIRLLPGHSYTDGGTSVLAFLPDSRRLFSTGDGYAAIWDVQTGKQVHSWDSYGGPATISPDGRFAAIATDATRVFEVASGKAILTLHAPPRAVTALAFSTDGRMLAAGEGQGSTAGSATGLRLWDAGHGRLERVLSGPPPDLHDVGFLPDGSVYSNSRNGSWSWNPRTGKRLLTLSGPVTSDEIGMPERRWQLLLPGGRKTVNEAGGPFNSVLQVRNASTHQLERILTVGRASLSNVSFSDDGRYMAVLAFLARGRGQTAQVWDVRTGERVSELDGIGMDLPTFAFAPDDAAVAGLMPGMVRMPNSVWLSENRLIVWDLKSGRQIQTVTLPRLPVQAICYSPDGNRIAAGIGAETRLFDARTLSVAEKLNDGDASVTALAFSPDGKRLAVGDEEGRIRLWDVAARKLLVTMVGFPTRDGSKVSPDWFAETPEGFYAWPNSAAPLIRFRKDGKMYPASAFEKTLRKTNLLGG